MENHLLRDVSTRIEKDENNVQRLIVEFKTLHYAAKLVYKDPANDPVTGDIKLSYILDANVKAPYLYNNTFIYNAAITWDKLGLQTTTVIVYDTEYYESTAISKSEEDVIDISKPSAG